MQDTPSPTLTKGKLALKTKSKLAIKKAVEAPSDSFDDSFDSPIFPSRSRPKRSSASSSSGIISSSQFSSVVSSTRTKSISVASSSSTRTSSADLKTHGTGGPKRNSRGKHVSAAGNRTDTCSSEGVYAGVLL